MQVWVEGDCRLSFEYINPHRTGEIILSVDNREVEILHNASSDYKFHHIDLPPGLHLITWIGRRIFPADQGGGSIRNIKRRPSKFLFDFSPTSYAHNHKLSLLGIDTQSEPIDTILWSPDQESDIERLTVNAYYSTNTKTWQKVEEELIESIQVNPSTGQRTFKIIRPTNGDQQIFYRVEAIEALAEENDLLD